MRRTRVMECAGRARRRRRFGFARSGRSRHHYQRLGLPRRTPKRRRASLATAVQDLKP